MSDEHKLTPEAWVDAHAVVAAAKTAVVVEADLVFAELKRLTERAEKAERERDAHRQAAEKAERAAAAMREALEYMRAEIVAYHDEVCVPVWTDRDEHSPSATCGDLPRINAALASDAGREFLSREEVHAVVDEMSVYCLPNEEPPNQQDIDDAIDEVIKERDRG